MYSTWDASQELSRLHAANMEAEIVKQLNHLVEVGLLVIDKTAPVLAYDEENHKIVVNQLINLRVRQHEYIRELENKIKNFEDLFSRINEALKNDN